MISFDLRCGHGHVFEVWFRSSADHEEQKGRGLLSCPFCDDRDITKAVMAPAVAAKGNQMAVRPAAVQAPSTTDSAPDSTPVPLASAGPEAVKQALAELAAMQAKIEAESDYVGTAFAEEARAIHYGETEARGIYGEATPEQARALLEEGVTALPLPFRTRRRADA